MLVLGMKIMILNGQCLRLADEPVRTINIDIQSIIDAAENNPLMSENIKDLVKKSENILFIASSDISEEVYDYIINICSGKNIAVISDNIPLKYMHYQTIFNHSNIEDYLFFGASAGRAPMLVNKNINNYDLIIVVSTVMINAYGGFLGSITTLFNAVTAPKTCAAVIKNALQDSLYNIQKISCGLTIRNPVYESIREGLITAGKAVHAFAINIDADYIDIKEPKHSVFAGDTFISQIEVQNIINNKYKAQTPPALYDGILLNTDCYNNVVYITTLIEIYCKRLQKGGRLLININDMQSFGNNIFQEIFNKNTLAEIADAVDETNYMESFYAFILKYYTLNYHIALPYNEKLNPVLRQAGLNPLKEDEMQNFLSNCNNKGIFE